MKKVLIVVTNHPFLGETKEANGTYAPELTHVVHELDSADIDYDIVSINGGKAPLYGTEIEDDAVNEAVLANTDFLNRINNTVPVSQIDISAYSAVFYPGGFGLLSDIATNEELAGIAAKHYEAGGLIAAVCHGPAALLPITLSDGTKLIASKQVTAFTREEEIDFGTIEKIPFLLEESLARSAKEYRKTQPWQSLLIEDDRVITGQNPASASAVGQAIVHHLNA